MVLLIEITRSYERERLWMIQAAIYFESFNPILIIVLKKNVAKKVDFLTGMSLRKWRLGLQCRG